VIDNARYAVTEIATQRLRRRWCKTRCSAIAETPRWRVR